MYDPNKDLRPAGLTTMSGFLQVPAADDGTASQPTAIGCKADHSGTGGPRKESCAGWAQKRREELQRGGRIRQRAGQGAAGRRKIGREQIRLAAEGAVALEAAVASVVQVAGEAAVAAATVAAAAAVASAVAAAEREVRQIGVWARVLKGELGMIEEQMSRGIAVAGDAVGGLGVGAGSDEEESRGWASVSSEEEVCVCVHACIFIPEEGRHHKP